MTVKTVGELREKMRWASDSCPLNEAFETHLGEQGFSLLQREDDIARPELGEIPLSKLGAIATDLQTRIQYLQDEKGFNFSLPGTHNIAAAIRRVAGLSYDKSSLERNLPLPPS